MSPEATSVENLDTIVHSQPTDTYTNVFNSTLLDDGTLFSSHTVNTLIDLEDQGQNTTRNNNTTTATETNNNTNFYQNQQHRHPVNSTELTKNLDPLNRNLPTLPSVNTPLPSLQRQNSVYFISEPVILKNSRQPTLTNNQKIQFTPQQLVNLVRQPNSQNTQQANAPTPYYLQAASTQTPSPVVCKTISLPRRLSAHAKVFDTNGHDTNGPHRPGTTMVLISTTRNKKNWQAFCREFQKTFANQQSQTQAKHFIESITRASVEQIKTPAFRIEKMTRKAYVNNAPDMRNAQMNDALVKALDPQLARIALKKTANQKFNALVSRLPFERLVEKIHQENITRTHTD